MEMWNRNVRGVSLSSVVLISFLVLPVGIGFTQEPVAKEPTKYRFVNATNGRFDNTECFWSLDNGKEWHSFAKEPTVPCPTGNGRVYFRLGPAPMNFDDRTAYWDFIEYAYEKGTWHGNTTQVDAFCIPITIVLGDQRVGIVESRRKLFEEFRKRAPQEFLACAKSDVWILSPCRAGFEKGGPNENEKENEKYFDKYIDEVWDMYTKKKPTPSNRWVGEVVDGALTFTPVGSGKSVRCGKKPTTQDVFLGTNELATNPQFCAAINRHVLADPADWNVPTRFYKAEPYNWYARFFHEHSLNQKAYGFCYDDVADQAAFFSGTGREVVITLNWDGK